METLKVMTQPLLMIFKEPRNAMMNLRFKIERMLWRDTSGNIITRRVGNRFLDNSENWLYEIRGDSIYDSSGNWRFELIGDRVYDAAGNWRFELIGDRIYDTAGNWLGSEY